MEKIAAVHFPGNALRSKILKKTTDVFGKTDVRQVYLFILIKSLIIIGDLVSSLFSCFQLTLAMHPGKIYMPQSFP